jgi:LPS sulfotransferase NodH
MTSFLYERGKMQPHTSYLICAATRSGSFLLCEALKTTGLAGQPEEYFIFN